MDKMLRFVVASLVTAGVGALGASTASAQSGTLSPGNPLITYTAGPFTCANASNNNPESPEPDCTLTEPACDSCDDFALTIDLPAGYTDANPGHRISIEVAWDPTNPANDFDVYIQDPVSGLNVVTAATSGNPEIASIPLQDGVRNFRIRVLVFSAVNTSFNGTIRLGEPDTGVPGVGTYAGSTDVWTCNRHLEGLSEIPGPPPTVFDHGNDGEPSVRFDPNGRAYVTGIAGVPAGAGLWATSDDCGQSYDFLGAVDAGAGGGDSDVETAPEPNILGNYNVYLSSLTLANITTAASFDGGTNFVVTPVSTPQPVDDRQWNAAHGSSILYLSYWQFPSGIIQVVRMDYSALGAPAIAGPFTVNAASALDFHRIGNMATDRRPLPPGNPPLMSGPDGEGNVYHTYINSPGGRVIVAVSHDFGVTWTNNLVFDGGAVTYDHVFSWLTVDTDGNVYVAFSDDNNIYYSASTNQGVNWSTPVRVNRGAPESRTAIFPQMSAGSGGRVAFTFYGHNQTGSQFPTADWKVFVSRTQNALAPVPAFEEMIVSDRTFHTGPVCQQGLNCACCRELTECFEIDVSPTTGAAFVTYGSFGGGGTYITRQVSGTSAYADITVPDLSGTCPTPPDCTVPQCIGDQCDCPGCTVVEDLDSGDQPPSPRADQNIRSVGVSEPCEDHPEGDNLLAFTIKVADLDPANLPPNGFWRVIFNTPTMHFVQVTNCAGSSGPVGTYGHFTTGAVTDGPLNGFVLDGDEETICMYIDRSLVSDPQPGSQLTAINADARVFAGNCPDGPAAFAPIDVTNSGQYTLIGNDSEQCCAAEGVPVVEAPANTFSLALAGANPFSGETRVRYSLPSEARVRIDVYNVAGQRVHTLVNKSEGVGVHTVAFNPKQARLGAGVYWLRMKAGNFENQIRVVALE